VRALTGADASLANPRAQKRASSAIRGAAALARVVNLGNVRGDAFVDDARGVARATTREAHDAIDRRLLRMFPARTRASGPGRRDARRATSNAAPDGDGAARHDRDVDRARRDGGDDGVSSRARGRGRRATRAR
jgi:hypothetical protein